MKVATLVSQYPAPSHTFIRREVAALRSLGIEVETYSIRPGAPLSPEDREEQARTFTVLDGSPARLLWPLLSALPAHPGRWLAALAAALRHAGPGARQRLRALAYLAEAMRLARELRRRAITHVHVHFANPASVVALSAARYLDLPCSLTLHGLSDFGGPDATLLPGKLAAAAFVATATAWGRDELLRRSGGAGAAKVEVVRCGVEVARLPRPARTAPGPGEPLVVVSVGRLAPEKAQVGLVESLAAAVRQGVDLRLVLVGGGGEEGRIRAAVAAAGLEARVQLTGPLPEAAALEAMAGAHLFALSSRMEGLPVVLMEALALELPVVAPAITGIPELVRDGETGLLYPSGDWEALAAALVRLARDPGLRARLGQAGRVRVLAEFDARRAAEPLARRLRAADGAATGTQGAGRSTR